MFEEMSEFFSSLVLVIILCNMFAVSCSLFSFDLVSSFFNHRWELWSGFQLKCKHELKNICTFPKSACCFLHSIYFYCIDFTICLTFHRAAENRHSSSKVASNIKISLMQYEVTLWAEILSMKIGREMGANFCVDIRAKNHTKNRPIDCEPISLAFIQANNYWNRLENGR